MFHGSGQIEVLYVRGDRESGFSVEQTFFPDHEQIETEVYFPLDQSRFKVTVTASYETPPVRYQDQQPVLALSDLEGNFQAFRDFLRANKVVDHELKWNFGQGHLVLLGDMVDRGHSTTQLLWFIYKLEQEAASAGGWVHFIIGNHEIKNLQGNFKSAADKYLPIAGILGKQQYELFGPDAVLGRWLQSKNAIEQINGHLFLHGGMHPDVANLGLSLEQMNSVIRQHYRQFYFPKKDLPKEAQMLVSTKTGPAWYRGFFQGEVSQEQLEASLQAIGAEAFVVGHTLQFSVNSQFEGRVLAIDVKHPDDYNASFPVKRSEGLLLENDKRFRVLDDGQKIAF